MDNSIFIEDVEISGIEYAARVSGLPHNNNPTESIERLKVLGKCVSGSGHDVSLSGIVVHHTVIADHGWWLQFGRYHFHQIISSQSKMHSLSKMELLFHKKTPSQAIDCANELRLGYEHGIIDFETLCMGMPLGLMLKAGVVTNYLQLKTIFHQRKKHKMSSWKEYCQWILSLPHMGDILFKT